MENKKDLPLRIINQMKRRELKLRLEEFLKGLQYSYNSIRAMEDFGEVPTDPKCLTSKWLNEVLFEKNSGVEDLPMPVAKKKEVLNMWDELGKQARQHITRIQKFFDEYGNVTYEVRDGIITITNKDAILDKASTMIVPEDAQKHYELWCGVRDAITELRKWEREHDLKKFPLNELIHLNYEEIEPTWFATAWCCGTFTKNAREKEPQAEIMRAVNEKMYL